MYQGRGRARRGTRGNRALLDLLTFAIQQAEIAGDADTVARLLDGAERALELAG